VDEAEMVQPIGFAVAVAGLAAEDRAGPGVQLGPDRPVFGLG
jgi:hypothetical protein